MYTLRRSLKANASDAHFAEGESVTQASAAAALTDGIVAERIGEFRDGIIDILQLFVDAPDNVPLLIQPLSSRLLNGAMMGVLSEVTRNGGVFGDAQVAHKIFMTNCFDVVDAAIRDDFIVVLDFLEFSGNQTTPTSTPEKPVFAFTHILQADPRIKQLIDDRRSSTSLVEKKFSMLLHILSAVGTQVYNLQQGPSVSQTTYLPPTVLTILNHLKTPAFGKQLVALHKIGAPEEKTVRQIMTMIIDKALQAHVLVMSVDGKGYKVDREVLQKQLMTVKGSDMTAIMNRYVPVESRSSDEDRNFLVDPAVEIFIARRTEVAARIMHMYDKLHLKEADACEIMDDGQNYVMRLVKESLDMCQQVRAAQGHTNAAANVSSLVVAGKSPVESAQKKKTLLDWWTAVVGTEIDSNVDGAIKSNSRLVQLCLFWTTQPSLVLLAVSMYLPMQRCLVSEGFAFPFLLLFKMHVPNVFRLKSNHPARISLGPGRLTRRGSWHRGRSVH